MGLFDRFRSKPRCPVDPGTREWIDFRWQWLVDEFGEERVRRAPVVLPTPEFFPDRYDGTEDGARLLLDRVCVHMGLDPGEIELTLYDESDPFEGHPALGTRHRDGTAGLYHEGDGRFHVSLEASNVADPLALVATIAHELGHVHLLGHGRLARTEEDHEPLTDLLTVYLGLGVFTANAALHERSWEDGNSSGWTVGRRGYLSMPMFGYALARFARARGETGSAWAREIRLDVRTAFEQALRFLAAESA